jgi:hypothetical protein
MKRTSQHYDGALGLNPSYKPREGTDGELHHFG